MGRRSVWSQPEVIEAASQFVVAADETWRLQRGDDPECRFFQRVVAGGHYRAKGGTRQGIYMCAPSGELLGSLNVLDGDRVVEALRLALGRWRALPEEARWLDDPGTIAPAHRWEWSYPEDGLVLTSVRRDLPETGPTTTERDRWNRDPVWFSADEARGWLPADLSVGSRSEVTPGVLERLVCFHLVDNARGQTLPFFPGDMEDARLDSAVTAVDGALVHASLRGRVRAVSDGVWKHGDNDWKVSGEHPRGVDLQLRGSLSYDSDMERFVAFELVAIGERWGTTPHNGRRGQPERNAIGFVFDLDTRSARVAPAFIDLYDADWVQRPAGGSQRGPGTSSSVDFDDTPR